MTDYGALPRIYAALAEQVKRELMANKGLSAAEAERQALKAVLVQASELIDALTPHTAPGQPGGKR